MCPRVVVAYATMTIGSTIPARVSFNCDGVTTVFPIPIQAYQASDITVVLTAPVSAGGAQTTLTLNSDYSMAAAGTLNPQQWTLTTLATSPYASGYTLQAFINPIQAQQTSYVQGQAFPSLALQTNLDRLTQMIQRLQDEVNRRISAPDGDVSPLLALPAAAARALMYLGFDANGNVLATPALPGTANTPSSLGPIINPLSTSESTQGLIPTAANQIYPVLDSRRYALDTTGSTDVTATIQKMLDTAGAAALDGEVREVVLYPGTYKVRRLYMHYSNVHLRIMPGATIVQTLTGITNSNTTGVAPAYAVIHINPLNYVANPSSGAAGTISNVRIYGGGTVQGPNTVSPGSYQQFQLGVVANDCNSFWIEGIHILGCGGETLLGDPSSWFTCTDLRAIGCEFSQGGEVGFNNCRASVMLNNYMHDAWFQNGLGIDGDNVVIGWNRVRNMPNSGLNFGGSGAHDLGAGGIARNILCIGNVVTATGLANSGSFQLFMTDDGATTVPKYNIKVIGNIFDNHLGPNQIAADYAVAGSTVEFVDNTVTNLQGVSPNAINIISGAATYILRGNVVNPGNLGNAIIGLTVSSANSPVVIVEESNSITGFPSGNINWSAAIILNQEYASSFTGSLTGCTTALNCAVTYVKKGNVVEMNLAGTAGTSNATTMTLTGMPAYLKPTRNQNFRFPVIDNGINLDGLLQVGSSGTITFFKDINASAFTNSGTKGTPGPYNVTYLLN